MFSFTKRNKEYYLTAVVDGISTALETVDDPVFSQKALGEGIAIIPEGEVVTAPCDGEIITIPDTIHAFSMRSDDGLELLVHIGIDTVALHGEGFTLIAAEGKRIKRGDPVIRFDSRTMKEKGLDMTTIVIMLNHQDYIITGFYPDKNVKAGENKIAEYKQKDSNG